MILMLLIQGLKVLWLCSQEILEKSKVKSEIRLIRKFLSGEKRERLRLFLVFFLLMRFICWILNVFLILIELWKVSRLLLLFWLLIEGSPKLEELNINLLMGFLWIC